MTVKPPAPTEYSEQCALMQWAELESKKFPVLSLLFASQNGLRLPIGLAVKAKKAGMRKGVPDLFLPVARGKYHGLFVELKRIRSYKVSDEQGEWIERLWGEGYHAVVCCGWKEASECIVRYLKRGVCSEQYYESIARH